MKNREEYRSIFEKCSFYNAFKCNFDRIGNSRRGGRINHLFSEPIDEWVNFGFCWSKTGEGDAYWRMIDTKWKSFVSSGGNESCISEWYKPSSLRDVAKTALKADTKPKRTTLNFRI